MTTIDISVFDAIHTQRAIRRFSQEAVSDELVTKLIESAIKAPSGANRQPWHFIVIRDEESKRKIGEWYLDGWIVAYGDVEPGSTISSKVYRSADYLARHMAEAPILIIPCIDSGDGSGSLGSGASIYPAVQNLMLAAIGLGLGTVLTTLHRVHEKEVKEFLGIPNSYATAALIPVGYPAEGEHFGGSRRRSAEEVTSYDYWGRKKTGEHEIQK